MEFSWLSQLQKKLELKKRPRYSLIWHYFDGVLELSPRSVKMSYRQHIIVRQTQKLGGLTVCWRLPERISCKKNFFHRALTKIWAIKKEAHYIGYPISTSRQTVRTEFDISVCKKNHTVTAGPVQAFIQLFSRFVHLYLNLKSVNIDTRQNPKKNP